MTGALKSSKMSGNKVLFKIVLLNFVLSFQIVASYRIPDIYHAQTDFLVRKSAPSEPIDILRVEKELVQIMMKEKERMQDELDKVNKVVKEYEDVLETERRSGSPASDMADKIFGNPLHVFKQIKRFTNTYPKLDRKLGEHDVEDVKSNIAGAIKCLPIPDETMTHSYASRMFQTQEDYHLNMTQYARGVIDGIKTKARMNAKDCILMGKRGFAKNMWARSVEWFETAYFLAREEPNGLELQKNIRDYLKEAAKEHDARVLSGFKGEDLFLKPLYEEPPNLQRKKLIQQSAKEANANLSLPFVSGNPSNEDLWHFPTAEDMTRHRLICNEFDLRPLAFRAKFRCHFSHRQDPYYYLHPVKIEEIHSKPEVRVFHDILSPKECSELVQMRAEVDKLQRTNEKYCLDRQTGFNATKMSRSDLNVHLTHRFKWVTGLNPHSLSEDGAVGIQKGLRHPWYEHHALIEMVQRHKNSSYMVYNPEGVYTGDHAAMAITFLNEDFKGGRASFPRLGAGVAPTQGSVVFWYSQLENGMADKTTMQGGCSVHSGIKSFMSNFFTEASQTFRRPCKLTQY